MGRGAMQGVGHAGRRNLVLVTLALISVVLVHLFSPQLALADALHFNNNPNDDVGQFTGDKNFGAYYCMENNYVAYCMDADLSGPKQRLFNSAGTVTGAYAYIAYHGFPQTTTICQHNLSRGDARAVTQIALWFVSSASRDALVNDPINDNIRARTDLYNLGYQFYQEALAWEAAGSVGPENNVFTWYSCGESSVQRILYTPEVKGKLTIHKTSGNTGLTSDNSCYSLSSSTFSVFRDPDCTQIAGMFATNAEGVSGPINLTVGTYYIREMRAPKGFALDQNVRTVTVTPNHETIVDIGDNPQMVPVQVLAEKVDAQTGEATPQGDGSLAGAQFTVTFYKSREGFAANAGTYATMDEAGLSSRTPDMTWVFVTDEQGKACFDQNHLIGGDALPTTSDGTFALPLGTVAVRETGAPSGYLLDAGGGSVHVFTLSGDTSGSEVREGYTPFTVKEQVCRGGMDLAKVDADWLMGTAQGDASLEGASFQVVNRSAGNVTVGDTSYAPGEVVLTLSTNAQGKVGCDRQTLPFGTYEVVEVSPSQGYLLNNSWSRTFSIREDGQLVSFDNSSDVTPEVVVRGGVVLAKRDLESGDTHPLGGATLLGTTFEIVNRSAASVRVNGGDYGPGSVVATLVTDETGYAQTASDALPYGSYEVRETQAPNGYLPNDEWSCTFEVREQGVMVDLTGDKAATNQVVRGDFAFSKVDEDTMARMAGVPFLVTSLTTGESHVLVTDENGMADTSSDWNPHSQNTNANDKACVQTEEGGWSIDEEALDPGAGVWFGKTAGSDQGSSLVSPQDKLGALPYDTSGHEGGYLVQELPCSANEGHRLVSFFVQITRNGARLDLGTIDDKAVTMGTELTTDEGSSHQAAVTDSLVLVDHVSYDGLTPGKTYVVSGTLHKRGATGADEGELCDKDGNPYVSEVEFVASAPSGQVSVPFTLDASDLSGTEVVAFERLSMDGRDLVVHEDISDLGQTVSFPAVTTLASSPGTAGNEALAQGTLQVTDTVMYSGLVRGKAYAVTGTLVDVATEEPVTDASGAPLTSTTTFVPTASSGTTAVVIDVPADELAGRNVVAFESLSCDGVVVATHEDPAFEDQTIHFPKIGTKAVGTSGEKYCFAGKDQVIHDTVTYENLAPDTDYEITGQLHLVGLDDGGSPCDAGAIGEPVTVTFHTPAAAKGETRVSGKTLVDIPCDLTGYQGCDVVVFEEVSRNACVVACHKDAADTDQTLHLPALRTEASAAEGEAVLAKEGQSLVDVVTYENLIPGKTYTLTARLVEGGDPSAEDSQEGTDKDGSEGTTTYQGRRVLAYRQIEVTPDQASGQVEVRLEDVDLSDVSAGSVVFFESLSLDEDLVATHEDASDEGQSVAVEIPEKPKEKEADQPKKEEAAGALPKTGQVLIPVGALALVGVALVLVGKHRRR